MEGLSVNAYNGFSRYWKRQRYERLSSRSSRRFRSSRFRLSRSSSTGGGQRRRRLWRWRIKISPKIRRFGSPKKWLARLRDAYVNMMLRFANSTAFSGGCVDNGGFGRAPVKEYDQKMIVEIYKSVLMAQAQIDMVARDAPNLPSQSPPSHSLSRGVCRTR